MEQKEGFIAVFVSIDIREKRKKVRKGMKELERVNGVGIAHHVLLLQLLNTEDLASNFLNFLMGR